MVFMWRLAAVLALGALVLLAPGPAHAAAPDGRVVLVGVTGLTAADLSAAATPALWRLKETGASGSLSVRTVRDATCPADAWLTLGAGARTAVADCDAPDPATADTRFDPALGT